MTSPSGKRPDPFRLLGVIVALLLLVAACRPTAQTFDGARALKHAAAQLDFGPRPVGTDANVKTGDYIIRVLESNGWEVEEQTFAHEGLQVRNIIGKKGEGPIIMLGAHYDTRPVADKDPGDRSQPVLGANDGASGVAVLLELSRALDERATDDATIWLTFFDAEDRDGVMGWPCCVGSGHMADSISTGLTERPEYVIVVDMVGDVDQQFYFDWNSSLWLQERLFDIAADLGYQHHFTPSHRYSIVDDHIPFLNWGMNAAVLTDFDYTYWHTRYDTLDKISADSLQRVGDVLETLLEGEPFSAGPVK